MEDIKSWFKASEDDEFRVLGWILLKGSSWTNEIADNLEYDLDSMKSIIKSMIKKDWIVRVTIDANAPSAYVMCRLSELHSKGIDKMERFQERNFYRVTETGLRAYWLKFKGQGKRINNCYMDEFDKMLSSLPNDNTKTQDL
ncbi:MAG: MarR family winged helix-turn-helix transcriptional regulator [Patescibacteria group bacterium]